MTVRACPQLFYVNFIPSYCQHIADLIIRFGSTGNIQTVGSNSGPMSRDAANA